MEIMEKENKFQRISKNQWDVLITIVDFPRTLENPYMVMTLNWIEKEYNYLIVTDIVGYQFVSIIKNKTDGSTIFYTDFYKTPEESKDVILNMFIEKILKCDSLTTGKPNEENQ